MNKTIVTNFYPLILWDIRVFGSKNKEETSSNLHFKEAYIEFDGNGIATSIKTNLVESSVSRGNYFEIAILKYLPIGILVFFLFDINLYYISMTGFFIGAFTYLVFFTLKKKSSAFFAYFFLLLSFFVYLGIMFAFPLETLKYKINWIVNYAVQYFLWLWVFEKVVMDIGTLDCMKWYKVDKFSTRYFKFNGSSEKRDIIGKSRIISNGFRIFILIIMFFTLFFGGVDLATKIDNDLKAKDKILVQDKNEREILRKKNARALKSLLESQSRKVGIKVHTDKDFELLENDFKSYIDTGVIAYELLQITPSSEFIEEASGRKIKIGFERPYYLVKSWVKKYKDGIFRWHFIFKGKVLVITNAKAR